MRSIFICLLISFGISEASGLSSYLFKRHSSASCNHNYIYAASIICYGDLMTLSEIPATNIGDKLHNIEEMCGRVETSSKCFSREVKRCGEGGTAAAYMLKEVFNFVCSPEGQSVLISSGSCWGHETLSQEIGVCTQTMNKGLSTLSYNDFCDVLDAYVSCIQEKARANEQCDISAELFLKEMVTITVRPTMEKLHCCKYSQHI